MTTGRKSLVVSAAHCHRDVEGDGILVVPNRDDASLEDLDGDEVDPRGEHLEPAGAGKATSGPLHLELLVEVGRLFRRLEHRGAIEGADLDEGQFVAIERDDVDLPMADMDVAAEDAQAAGLQVRDGGIFTEAPHRAASS